jgi:hypothetical protein
MDKDTKTKRCYGSPKYGIPGHDNVPLSEFGKDSSRKDGLRSRCRRCSNAAASNYYKKNPEKSHKASAKYRAKNPEKVKADRIKWRSTSTGRAIGLIAGARSRAQKKGLMFDLDEHIKTVADILEKGYCQLSGLPFDFSFGRPKPNSPSIDQIVAGKGYTRNNIRVICWIYNVLFNEWGEEASIPYIKAQLSILSMAEQLAKDPEVIARYQAKRGVRN